MRQTGRHPFWLLAAITCAFVAFQHPEMDGAILSNGSILTYGNSLNSNNGTYHLQHQLLGSQRVLTWDHTYCQYGEWSTAFDVPAPQPPWFPECVPPYTHTNQWGNGDTGNYLAMQTDGNLVLYNGSNSAIWSTSTNGYGSSAVLNAQDDGNLVVYYNTNVVIWALF